MLIIPFYVINSIDGSLQTFLYRRPDKVFFVFKKNFAGHAGPVGTAQLWRYRAEGAVDTR